MSSPAAQMSGFGQLLLPPSRLILAKPAICDRHCHNSPASRDFIREPNIWALESLFEIPESTETTPRAVPIISACTDPRALRELRAPPCRTLPWHQGCSPS